jgi:oligoendopeptidase F
MFKVERSMVPPAAASPGIARALSADYSADMTLLPFDGLPPHRPRQFLPPQIDLGDWGQLKPFFDRLEAAGALCGSAADLERWLLDWSELSAALEEEGSRRYIAMTCHTDNAEAEQAYLHFVEHIEPEVKPRQFTLETLYVGHPHREQLIASETPVSDPAPLEPGTTKTPGRKPALPSHYAVFDRDTRNHVELFRPDNVPLETEESKLSQQYQKLSGGLTVSFRGEERTLVQMGRYQEETDRALREEAWKLVARRRLQEQDAFDEIFDKLVALRQQIARNAGFPNYRDYAFRRLGRFDYAPDDCARFHDAVEGEVMPVVRELQAERRARLKLDALRPWDLAVDPLNRPPLKPFAEVGEMVTRTQRIFDRLDGELAAGFGRMRELRLLDLANRKGKAPGGYQSTLAEARAPFIFMNAVGLQRDVETILHEAGHAFHALAAREEDLLSYRSAPIEFCEVASMSMELLGNEFIEEFYSAENATRARRTHLEGILGIFPWIATVDAFQHWVYTHPGHTRAERSAAWLGLMDRFGGDVDWRGCEEARAHLWHRQLHIFIHAFYYIEYGIAQLGALQVWANSKRDKAKALHAYKQALALGGSRRLPELFQAAGCRFAFDRQAIQPLVRLMQEELQRL